MNILLTNDDGIFSPLLAFLAAKFKALGNLIVVAPKYQQSWKAKSITCGPRLAYEECQIAGLPAYAIEATPADCANIGIYNISETKPDLILSGINAGVNTGVSFAFSSGTLGACFEANIAGIPAIACSQELDKETFLSFREHKELSRDRLADLEQQVNLFLDTLIASLFENGKEISKDPLTYNFNFPHKANDDPKVCKCSLGDTYYEGLFIKDGDAFVHHLTEAPIGTKSDTDEQVLKRGDISLSVIDIREFGQL